MFSERNYFGILWFDKGNYFPLNTKKKSPPGYWFLRSHHCCCTKCEAHCTIHIAHCTPCTLYIVQCTMHIVQYEPVTAELPTWRLVSKISPLLLSTFQLQKENFTSKLCNSSLSRWEFSIWCWQMFEGERSEV